MKGPSPVRRSEPTWLRPVTERLPPTIRTLVIIMSVVYGIYIMAGSVRGDMARHLALTPYLLTGEVWQPLTALFIHLDAINFFFSMLGLWWVGATVERNLGRRKFLVLFFGAGLVSNLFLSVFLVLGAQAVFTGCGDAVLGLFVAFGVLYGRTQVRVFGALAMEARTLAAILVGISVLSAVMQGAFLAVLGTVCSALFAYVVAGGKINDLTALLRRNRRSRIQVLNGGKRGPTWMN